MEIVRQKNAATIITFPIVDADGDTVTAATSPDSEIDTWSDGAAPDGFTDCTNEATEIGTTGIYYLSLTQSEMNVDYIYVQVKTGTAGAKTQHILIRTIVGDPLNIATSDDGGSFNVAAGVIEAQVKSIDANAITATAIASDAITAAKIATDAITAAKIAADAIGASELAADAVTEIQSGLSTLTEANIRTAVGLASANLDTQLSTIDDFLDTEIAAIKAKTDNLPTDPADASDIATSFSTVNTKLDTIDDFLDTEVAAILADTNELQTDLTDGGRLDLLIDAIKAKTDNLPADPADASDIASSFSSLNTKVDTIDDFLDTEVAAIKAKTDNLPADPADASDIAASFSTVNTKLDAIDDYVDTEVAAVKAVTDKLDTALELDGPVYRYTTNALEQAPGGSAPTAVQNAAAVWDKKVDDHVSDRSFGSKIGLYLPVVSPDIDYKRIRKVVNEEIKDIPAPNVDLIPISEGLQALLTEIRAIDIPKPEKVNLEPILAELEALQNAIKAIPEPDYSSIHTHLEKQDKMLSPYAEEMKDKIETLFGRIKEFFTNDVDGITAKVDEVKKQLDGMQFVKVYTLDEKEKEKPTKKENILQEYLKQ